MSHDRNAPAPIPLSRILSEALRNETRIRLPEDRRTYEVSSGFRIAGITFPYRLRNVRNDASGKPVEIVEIGIDPTRDEHGRFLEDGRNVRIRGVMTVQTFRTPENSESRFSIGPSASLPAFLSPSEAARFVPEPEREDVTE